MPRKVDADSEFQRRVRKAEQKREKALQLAEIDYQRRLKEAEAWKAEFLLQEAERKKVKEEKPKEPRVRRTKEQIEIDEAKERLKKQYDESHKRHLEGKASSSNTAPPITSADRNRLEVFGGVSSFLGFDDEEEEEEEEEVEDEWDLEGMSENTLRQLVAARHRNGMEIPPKYQKYLEPQKKKSRVEDDEVIIPEEELTPLPPPKPQTLSKQEERRKPVKQVKGVHSYSLPLE